MSLSNTNFFNSTIQIALYNFTRRSQRQTFIIVKRGVRHCRLLTLIGISLCKMWFQLFFTVSRVLCVCDNFKIISILLTGHPPKNRLTAKFVNKQRLPRTNCSSEVNSFDSLIKYGIGSRYSSVVSSQLYNYIY